MSALLLHAAGLLMILTTLFFIIIAWRAPLIDDWQCPHQSPGCWDDDFCEQCRRDIGLAPRAKHRRHRGGGA